MLPVCALKWPENRKNCIIWSKTKQANDQKSRLLYAEVLMLTIGTVGNDKNRHTNIRFIQLSRFPSHEF